MSSYEVLNNNEGYYSNPDPFTLERYKQFAKRLLNHPQKVLDVGCNMGRGGEVLKNYNSNFEIFGLDCVQDFLDRIPEAIYSHKIYSQSTTSIPLASSSLDAIVSGEFIEHLYPQDVEQTLREFHRLLQAGGQLLLTTPNPNYFILKLTGKSVICGPHVSEHYPQKLKQQLQNLGFKDIKFFGSGKVSRFLGERFPLLMMYGSYLAIATKA